MLYVKKIETNKRKMKPRSKAESLGRQTHGSSCRLMKIPNKNYLKASLLQNNQKTISGNEKNPHFLSTVCSCVHGVCNSGIDGDGSCECYSAYTGSHCDQRKYCWLPECLARSCRYRRMHFNSAFTYQGPPGVRYPQVFSWEKTKK